MGALQIYYLVFTIILYFQAAKSEDCDKLGVIIYEDLGCKPVLEKGKVCPIKYDCDLEVKNRTCLFRGLEIPVGEDVNDDLIYGNCEVGCRCIGGRPSGEDLDRLINGEDIPIGGDFTCASLDCVEYFGRPKLEPGCHRNYELDKCCAHGVKCEKSEEPLTKCKVSEEQTVKEGQQFYPPNTCLKCVCPKNFNGKFEEPHCMRIKCAAQVRYQKEIIDHCAPFYSSSENDPVCCPQAWICPKAADKIITVNPKADQKSDLRCRFGSNSLKLGEGLETTATIRWNQKVVKAKCECVLPPLLACREIKEIIDI